MINMALTSLVYKDAWKQVLCRLILCSPTDHIGPIILKTADWDGQW